MDEDALEQFLVDFPALNVTPYSQPTPVPNVPVSTPAGIQNATGASMTLTDTSATLCEVTLVTATSGKIEIWANVDISGDPVTLTTSINGSIVATTTSSLFLFYGTPTAEIAGTYTISLRATTTGSTNIVSSRLMVVGLLN